MSTIALKIAIIKKLLIAMTALLALLQAQHPMNLGMKLGGALTFPVMSGSYIMWYECFRDRASFDTVKIKTPENTALYSTVREITGTEKDTIGSCHNGLLLEVAKAVSNESDAHTQAKALGVDNVARFTDGSTLLKTFYK